MPLLREFKALTQSAGASLFAYPCELTNIDGTLFSNVTAVPLYFQIFDKASAPVANDIPIKSFVILTGGPFPLVSVFQNMGPVEFALGFAVGISSAHEKYTAATAVYDVFGEIVEGYQQSDAVSGLSILGDTSSATNVLALWNSGDNGNKNRLFRLTITNLAVTVRWAMVFPVTTNYPREGQTPMMAVQLAGSETKTVYFGVNGLTPLGVAYDTSVTNPAVGTTYLGAGVILSTTGNVLTTDATNNMYCKAWYKTT